MPLLEVVVIGVCVSEKTLGIPSGDQAIFHWGPHQEPPQESNITADVHCLYNYSFSTALSETSIGNVSHTNFLTGLFIIRLLITSRLTYLCAFTIAGGAPNDCG